MQRHKFSIIVVSLFLLVLAQGIFAAHDHPTHGETSNSACQICHVGHFGKAALPEPAALPVINVCRTIPAPSNTAHFPNVTLVPYPARGPPA